MLGFVIRLHEDFLCQPSGKWVTFSNQRKIRQQKERAGLRLSFAVRQWDTNLLPLRLLGYGKLLPLNFMWELFLVFLLLIVSLALFLSLSGRRLDVDCNTD